MALAILMLTGCRSGDGGARRDDGPEGSSDPISSDEVNRYQLTLSGDVTLDDTGGLGCRVDDGVLTLEFRVDAYDGPINYQATVPDFDPANSALEGTFTFSDAPGTSMGAIEMTFSIGDPPEGFEEVVRAAGVITGSMSGNAGPADIKGSYACFLMNSEVGL